MLSGAQEQAGQLNANANPGQELLLYGHSITQYLDYPRRLFFQQRHAMDAVDAVRAFLWSSSPVNDRGGFGLSTPLSTKIEEEQKKSDDNPEREKIGALTVSGNINEVSSKFIQCENDLSSK